MKIQDQNYVPHSTRHPPLMMVGKFIDRSETGMDDNDRPLAPGVALASRELLRRVGYRPGMPIRPEWRRPFHRFFRADVGDGCTLVVSQFAKFWEITRFRWDDELDREIEEDLAFGTTLIVTQDYVQAMQLARFCHYNEPPARLGWLELVNKKTADELLQAARGHASPTQSHTC